MYKIIENDKEKYAEIDLYSIKEFSYGMGTRYLIEKDSKPFVLVEFGGISPFDDVCLFGNYLCAGVGDKIHFTNLETFESKIVSLENEMYFGYFYEYNHTLFVASGTGVTAFDKDLSILWKNSDIAVDGVIFERIAESGKYIEVSCEMNPPGDWHTKYLDINTGDCCE